MAINDIINESWQGHSHGEVEDALKSILQQILTSLEQPIANNSVGINALTQALRDLINNAVPNTRTINGKRLNNDVTLKTSDLDNDSGFITEDDLPEGSTVDGELDENSDNAVSNAAVCGGLAEKVDKETGKGLSTNDFTTALKNKLNSLPTAAELEQALANAGSGAVSVTTNEDGTFIIHVGETDYTINLNHTHENMAKLIVVDDEEDLPAQLAADTIYGVSDGEEISVVYIGGLPFYGGGGGGGSTSPVLREPAANSTINVGTNTGSGASKSITVKGKNLTQDLTLELTGSGFAFDSTQATGVTVVSTTELTVSAAAANQTGGVAVVVKYTGTTVNATGQLEISSTGEINVACTLTASYEIPDQSYNEAEAKAAFQDSTLNNKWLKADASAVGSAPAYTNDGQGAQGCYVLKIPLAGVAVLRYPVFKTSSGFGSVVCDANGNVVWGFANDTCNDGVMNTVHIASIEGASYALIQLYNVVTNYTIEISGDFNYGLTTDKALVQSSALADAVGYCVSNGYSFLKNHTYKINAGFTQSPDSDNKFGLKFFGISGSGSGNFYSVDNNQDGNGIMSVSATSTDGYGKVTFKTSELDDCYIYDNTAGVYIFKGRNVNTNNS